MQSALAGIGGLNGGGHRRRRTDVNRAVCAGEWRAGSPPRAQPALDACDGGAPGGVKAGQQREQAKDLREACPVGLEAGKRSIDDLLASFLTRLVVPSRSTITVNHGRLWT